MRIFIRILLIAAVLGGIATAAYKPVNDYLKKRNRPDFKLAEIGNGTIRLAINATGEIKPKLAVQIGSVVSGPIIEINADFNQPIKKQFVMARIDPEPFEAQVARDQANLDSNLAIKESRQADVRRVKALLGQAIADEKRAMLLFEEDEDFISDTEMDGLRFSRESLEAQLDLAKASLKQADAGIEQARSLLQLSAANLEYTLIKAPYDGIVIDRKIDPGQTLAASFQTPEMFVLGIDMKKEMHIYAAVDEADIGLIKQAKTAGQPVRFRVDAYRDELFDGKIDEIRMSSTETQGVITYPVIVMAPNPELKLLPGMTANLTFQIEERKDVVRIPWSALRFFPKPEMVREEDQTLLTGSDEENQENVVDDLSATDVIEAAKKSKRRHVWVVDGEKLKAVAVTLGISDYKYAELVEGDLTIGAKLVTGINKKKRGR
ncbi:MAG: HlyD family efflux transporter periplasmic adaptor subunit [Planctomycetaceae bacterium]|nr:HlyD family efflux transporter periplasmic adaptor subunit [Planctomycetaceae bacterium]